MIHGWVVHRPMVHRRTVQRVLVIAFIVLAALVVPSGEPPLTLGRRLSMITRSSSFNLWSWELDTLTSRAERSLFDRPSTRDGPAVVRAYVQLSQEADRARATRDNLWAREEISGSPAGLDQAQAKLDYLEGQLSALRPTVEATLSQEIEAELQRRQIRNGLVTWERLAHFPFYQPEVVPGVFFQLGPLPDLLVVAPRDRIELTASVLLQPGLSPDRIDSLENQTDALGVSSLVVGIGGLAAYPSMIPDDDSLSNLVITVAHEWTHHYLALHPLGMAYFESYQMREINETVADMVGHEIGGAVYEQIYASSRPAAPPPSAAAPSNPGRPSFDTLLRKIRLTVEADLARGDVAGADRYMAQAQQNLARQGYYVRRLNTAYLAFYGSYAATGNPYEAKLRRLRAQSGSLARFLKIVSQVSSPADLDRLLQETRTPTV